jgi:hypothetical protein
LKERHYLVFRIRPCQGEQQRNDWHNKMKACKDRLPTFDVSYNDLMDCIEHIDLVTAQQVSMLAKYQFGRRSFRTNIHLSLPRMQGCQMVCFQTKNHDLGKFCRGLAIEHLGIFYDHLVYFTKIGNI